MATRRKSKRKYKKYSAEFKQEAVEYCQKSDKSIAEVARELDIPPSSLKLWMKKVQTAAEAAALGPLSSEERQELHRLRAELKKVRMERDFLKKATAFFANQNK